MSSYLVGEDSALQKNTLTDPINNTTEKTVEVFP